MIKLDESNHRGHLFPAPPTPTSPPRSRRNAVTRDKLITDARSYANTIRVMIQHVYLDQKKRKERKKEEIGTDRHGDRQERRERRQCDQKKRENIFKNKRNKKGKMFLWLVHFSCFFSPEFLGCCRWRWATIPSLVSIFLCFVGCDS